MKENFKYIAKLSTTAIASFLKINGLGLVSTLVVVIVELILLAKNSTVEYSEQISTVSYVSAIFSARPISSILCLLTLIGSPFVFFTLGNKYILVKLIDKLIKNKSESLINPLLEKVILKFKTKQPVVLRNVGDFSISKLKIIQEIKNDKAENKWLRKIIVLAMEKVQLDEVDFTQDNISFYEILKQKTIQSLKEISEPSRKLIFIAIGIQWTLLLFIWLTKY